MYAVLWAPLFALFRAGLLYVLGALGLAALIGFFIGRRG